MLNLNLFFKASKNVMGLNERNISFTKRLNKGKARRLADNKYRSYRLLKKNDIPIPETYKILKNQDQVAKFGFDTIPNSFVIKPAFGLGGSGNILIFSKSKKNDQWIGVNGKKYNERDLKAYCTAILENAFALDFAEKNDFVIIQERIKITKNLRSISYPKGIPDIRIIYYKDIPLMGMLRLPTKQSGGKANLHLGGVGVGIDIATGITTYATSYDEKITHHPDTGVNLSGFSLPMWKEILKIGQKAVNTVGLKFGAVDIVLDIDRGPVVLELNARPGLAIQLANQEGLKGRINRIKGVKPKSLTHARTIGMNLFGGEVEDTVFDVSGMQVVGFIAMANFYGINEKVAKRVKVKNDTGALYSSIDRDLAVELGFESVLEDFDKLGLNKVYHDRAEALENKRSMAKLIKNHPEILGLTVVKSGNGITVRPKVSVEIKMEGKKIETTVNIADRSNMLYKGIIGRVALRKNFLVDSNKIFNRYKD